MANNYWASSSGTVNGLSTRIDPESAILTSSIGLSSPSVGVFSIFLTISYKMTKRNKNKKISLAIVEIKC